MNNNMNTTAYSTIESSFKVSDLDIYTLLDALSTKSLKQHLRERDIPIPKMKCDMVSALGLWVEFRSKTVNFQIL